MSNYILLFPEKERKKKKHCCEWEHPQPQTHPLLYICSMLMIESASYCYWQKKATFPHPPLRARGAFWTRGCRRYHVLCVPGLWCVRATHAQTHAHHMRFTSSYAYKIVRFSPAPVMHSLVVIKGVWSRGMIALSGPTPSLASWPASVSSVMTSRT